MNSDFSWGIFLVFNDGLWCLRNWYFHRCWLFHFHTWKGFGWWFWFWRLHFLLLFRLHKTLRNKFVFLLGRWIRRFGGNLRGSSCFLFFFHSKAFCNSSIYHFLLFIYLRLLFILWLCTISWTKCMHSLLIHFLISLLHKLFEGRKIIDSHDLCHKLLVKRIWTGLHTCFSKLLIIQT